MKMSDMDKINHITYMYNDALYCAAMLGEESGKKRASDGFDTFKKEITEAASQTLTKEDAKNLLEKTICMEPKAFLVALNVCNDFDAFSTVLDALESKMKDLEEPGELAIQRGLEFFSLIMSADTRKLPKLADFNRYKEMRTALLAQSATPDGELIRTVVAQFENQFSADNSEEPVQCRIS